MHLFGHVHEEPGYTVSAEDGVVFVNGSADLYRNVYLLEVKV